LLHIDVDNWYNFILKVQEGYNFVPYHNKTHAADVAQTLYYFVMGGDWMEKAELDNVDLFSMILAGSIHDHEHLGYNNLYMINTQHELAIKYNDISVMENHHVASSFKIIKSNKKFNIF